LFSLLREDGTFTVAFASDIKWAVCPFWNRFRISCSADDEQNICLAHLRWRIKKLMGRSFAATQPSEQDRHTEIQSALKEFKNFFFKSFGF